MFLARADLAFIMDEHAGQIGSKNRAESLRMLEFNFYSNKVTLKPKITSQVPFPTLITSLTS